MKRLLLLAAGIIALSACSDATSPTQVANPTLRPTATFATGNNTVVVSPTNMDAWVFYNDETDAIDASLGSFVAGPATPVYGGGSAQISVTGTQRRNLATYQFAGIALSDITVMKFRTYNPSAGNGGSASRSAYLNFNVDFDGSDAWQRRLVFLPSDNGTVTQNSWKEWDAINGGNALWRYSGATWPVTGEPGTTTKTWDQIKIDYPEASIWATDAHLGLRVGEPYADGYTENIDSFTFGTATGTTVYDFEPTFGACSVSVVGSTMTLLSNCVTDRTLHIPDGYTLDGDGKSITAVDPAGGHFLGAVVMNGGTSASVQNLTVTASGLANVCDDGADHIDRLRGILFQGASGSIINNNVTANQGPSGCQEGNGIEVRNAPFDKTGTDKVVTISGNTVSSYIKNGITANGSVNATITNNIITGNGPLGVPYSAQNGIQIGFGATAIVKGNTVTGNNYTPASYVACGVLLYDADGVKASSNSFSGNEKDMCNYGKGGGKVNASN